MQPTAAAAPQGVVTRHAVVPAPPILVPHVRGPAAAAERDAIETIRGLAHAATTAWRRNLLRDSPSGDAFDRSMGDKLRERKSSGLSVVSALERPSVPPRA